MNTVEKIVKKPRKYYPENADFTQWDAVKKELEALLHDNITSVSELVDFLYKSSEFSSILMEEMAWRYINMTRYADDESYATAFNEFYSGVISQSKPYSFQLEKKYYESPYRNELDKEEYGMFDKNTANRIQLFREENIPLEQQEMELAQKYGSIFGQLTVQFDGAEKTIAQMGIYQKEQDRTVRENAWRSVMNVIATKKDVFEKLFDDMKVLRVKQAKNAGFSNYRDFMHINKGRFDYTPDDIYEFHDSVETIVIPFLKKINENKRKKLGVSTLRPWDTSVDPEGIILKPFTNTEEFVSKAISVLHKVKPEYAQNLNRMKHSGLLDLENRKGKAPGGYNYPLHETGAPFIFMNAVGLHRDVTTLLHESGHAMHSFATAEIPLLEYRETPSEVAEVASMAMELITIDHWDIFYASEKDLKKAREEQLEGTLSFMPWAMTVDAFQHWIYTYPEHTPEERNAYFTSLMKRFNPGIDWEGLEEELKIMWMKQLHIFEVPFYYIEYAISQLAALAIYREYKTKGKLAVENYEKFLRLGYSKPISKLYEAAGIKFDFSKDYIAELVSFVEKELALL